MTTTQFRNTQLRRSIIAYLESEPEGRGADGLPVPVGMRSIAAAAHGVPTSQRLSPDQIRTVQAAIRALGERNLIEADPIRVASGAFLWRRPVRLAEAQDAAEFHAARLRELLDVLVDLPRGPKRTHRPRPAALVIEIMDTHITAKYWASRVETPGVDGWVRGRRVHTRRAMPSATRTKDGDE